MTTQAVPGTETQPTAVEAQAQPTPGAPASPVEGDQTTQFKAWYEAHVKPELDKRDAEIHSLKSSHGRIEASLKKAREWDEETTNTFIQAYGTYEGRKTHWAKQGVPDWLLESTVPSKLDEVAEKFMASKPATQAPPMDAQFKAFQEWQQSQQGNAPARAPAGRVSPNGGAPAISVQVTRDNIDALYLEGKVSGDKYRNFLNSGEL